MAGSGYSHVVDKDFIDFAQDLSEGAWKDVATKKYDSPSRKSAQVFDAPRPVVWKLRAMWAISDLDKAFSQSSTRVREALVACASTFNAIHEEMSWFVEHLPPGPARDYLEALEAPFLTLLERYPANTGVSDERRSSDSVAPPPPSPSASAPPS